MQIICVTSQLEILTTCIWSWLVKMVILFHFPLKILHRTLLSWQTTCWISVTNLSTTTWAPCQSLNILNLSSAWLTTGNLQPEHSVLISSNFFLRAVGLSNRSFCIGKTFLLSDSGCIQPDVRSWKSGPASCCFTLSRFSQRIVLAEACTEDVSGWFCGNWKQRFCQ